MDEVCRSGRVEEVGAGTSCTKCTQRSCANAGRGRQKWVGLARVLAVLLVLTQCPQVHGRRKFSLWLKKGADLQQRLGLSHPLFLVENGLVSDELKENAWWWPQRLEPIEASIGHYDFRWKAISKNIRYEIIVGSAHSYFLPKPTIQGVPMNGTVPQKLQAFSLHFPCHPEADEHVTTMTVEFRFYRGNRRRIPLFHPGQVMLTLTRKCPPRQRAYTQVEERPECSRICELRKRSGRELRRIACASDYVVRARVTRQLNPLDPESGMALQVERQYRSLKAGPKDSKVLLTEAVPMTISYNVSDCPCIESLKVGEPYLFLAQQVGNGRVTFADTSLVAHFNNKAQKVLKRLRASKAECVHKVIDRPASQR